MTGPAESTPSERDGTIGDQPIPADLGYPGLGYGDVEPLEEQFQSFDEMLPAARAFYRRSSKT